MSFNNSADKKDLITKRYTMQDIETLTQSMESGSVSFSNFKKDFDAQCVRQTHQGYYVVLLTEDEQSVFVFFNKENTLVHVMTVDAFQTKEDFQKQTVGLVTKSDMLLFDPNTILLPISAMDVTAHMVQEGVYIVTYTRVLNGELLEDPIVCSVEFIETQAMPLSEDALIKDEVPFIWELDKAGE